MWVTYLMRALQSPGKIQILKHQEYMGWIQPVYSISPNAMQTAAKVPHDFCACRSHNSLHGLFWCPKRNLLPLSPEEKAAAFSFSKYYNNDYEIIC